MENDDTGQDFADVHEGKENSWRTGLVNEKQIIQEKLRHQMSRFKEGKLNPVKAFYNCVLHLYYASFVWAKHKV